VRATVDEAQSVNFSAGPLTGLLAIVAACVGAGVLLGGFVAGLVDFARLGTSGDVTWSTRIGGYVGGIVALVLLAFDLLIG
jgi:hypothetical protein